MISIRITSQLDEGSQDTIYSIGCGNLACGLRREKRYPMKRADIDVYNTFVDEFASVGA